MWTRQQVLAASHAWQWVPPGAEELHIDDVLVIDYPEWARMGFYAMPQHVADPDRTVPAVCEAARSRGRPATEWWVTPSTSEALEAALIERGAVASDAADILAYDMSGGIPQVPVPSDLRAVVVTDAQSLDDAETVAAAVWGGDPSSGERREAQLRSLGDPLDDQGAFRQTLLTRLEVAHEHGARLALVHARVNTSKPILTRLGFHSYGHGRLYTLTV